VLLLLLLQDGLRVAVQLVGPGHLVRTARGGAHELMAEHDLKGRLLRAHGWVVLHIASAEFRQHAHNPQQQAAFLQQRIAQAVDF
jgi:hypothetical protein